MTRTEIKKLFPVHAYASKPLYAQLSEKIGEFIRNSEPGTKFPPERVVAAALGINRETLRRALDEFVQKGLLKRARKGTIVGERQDVTSTRDAHPLAMATSSMPPCPEPDVVRLALYEDLPNQKNFWRKAIELFMARNPGTRLAITWIPREVNTSDKYVGYVSESSVDLFLSGFKQAETFKKNGLLEAMPENITSRLKTGRYHNPMLGFDGKRLSTDLVPVHVSGWIAAWNQRMALDHGLESFGDIIRREGLAAALRLAQGKLDRDVIVSGNVWNFLSALGMPTDANGLDGQFFLGRFESLRLLAKGHPRVFITRQTYPSEALELFRSGKLFAFIGSVGFVLNLMPFDFPLRCEWLLPEQNLFLAGDPSCVAVKRGSPSASTAWQFVDFLLQDEAQRLIASENVNVPYLRNAWSDQNGIFGPEAFQRLEMSFAKTRASIIFPAGCIRFLTYDLQDLFDAVADGSMQPDAATDEAVRRWEPQGKVGERL